MHRKEFLSTSLALSAAAIFPQPLLSLSQTPVTIQQVIDRILAAIPGTPFKQTVDTIKSGNADRAVTGIITTMFATIPVIEAAAKAGANFIIAHEPTFYNHKDEVDWLENDDTYRYKKALLERHRITVWRCHDYLHAFNPDGVMTGVLAALGWQAYKTDKRFSVTVPPMSLRSVISLVKEKLNITHLRYIGDLSQSCSNISLIPGAAGGRTQVTSVSTDKPDLLMVGEVSEWETAEYIRDLRAAGGKTALLVLGHVMSEEPGLTWLTQWLRPQLPGVSITHLPSGAVFNWA